jgi:azurin
VPEQLKRLLTWAQSVPEPRRTEREYVEVVQTLDELARLLPAGDAAAMSRELRRLRVPVFVVRTIREQMRYDTTRLVVVAGKPFEIILENNDMMPHNLAIVKPGAREQVGRMADAMPARPDRRGRAFVPRTDLVLAATRLLEPGESETLKLTAPAEVGAYEYVCTYPEHWKIMFGELVVVKDEEAMERALALPAPTPTMAGGHEH